MGYLLQMILLHEKYWISLAINDSTILHSLKSSQATHNNKLIWFFGEYKPTLSVKISTQSSN